MAGGREEGTNNCGSQYRIPAEEMYFNPTRDSEMKVKRERFEPGTRQEKGRVNVEDGNVECKKKSHAQ